MLSEVCRACDGRKETVREDRDNCMKTTRKPCSRCNATGMELNPSKGGKRRWFGSFVKKTDEEMTMEEKTLAFLRSARPR